MADKTTKKAVTTRATAEKLIAQATTKEQLEDERFAKHSNKHVQAKLKTKLAKLAS